MHTSRSRNSASEFMGMCVCMVNEWDVWGLSKLTQTYISSDRFTTLYKAFCYNKITRPMGYNVAQLICMWVRACLYCILKLISNSKYRKREKKILSSVMIVIRSL
jgi:hypothetical protein